MYKLVGALSPRVTINMERTNGDGWDPIALAAATQLFFRHPGIGEIFPAEDFVRILQKMGISKMQLFSWDFTFNHLFQGC